ncbi:hypothetical protein AAKU61_004089 [Undibacterium sp. GrIS 1.2]|uniref:hypothetical protein n=1 Tax=Undibacterium sp. GrIS 1.2 TaxID=3143933 RepID=UPI0033911EEE
MFELLFLGGAFLALYTLITTLSEPEFDFSSSPFDPSSLLTFDSGDAASTSPLVPDHFDSVSYDNDEMMPRVRMGYPGDGMPPSEDNYFQQYIGNDPNIGSFEHNDFQAFEMDVFGGNGMSDLGCSIDFSISSCDSMSFNFD